MNKSRMLVNLTTRNVVAAGAPDLFTCCMGLEDVRLFWKAAGRKSLSRLLWYTIRLTENPMLTPQVS